MTMVTAKITHPDGWECCPNGWDVTRYEPGEIVTGQVAEWALQDKVARRMLDKSDIVPENKAIRARKAR